MGTMKQIENNDYDRSSALNLKNGSILWIYAVLSSLLMYAKHRANPITKNDMFRILEIKPQMTELVQSRRRHHEFEDKGH